MYKIHSYLCKIYTYARKAGQTLAGRRAIRKACERQNAKCFWSIGRRCEALFLRCRNGTYAQTATPLAKRGVSAKVALQGGASATPSRCKILP